MKKNKNTQRKTELIKELLSKNYEPGRNDRCKAAVWRNVVNKIYPMSERTFRRYISEKKDEEDTTKQPGLFDNLEDF